jgi:PAS domain S-box-containing protein
MTKTNRNQSNHRDILKKIPVMYHSIDRSGTIMEVSDFWLEKMGYGRADVIGRKSTDFLTQASKELAEELLLPQFFKNGFAENAHYQMVKKDLSVMDVLMSARSLTDQDGRFKRSLAVMIDVTEQKRVQRSLERSERKFRLVMETIHDVFWIRTCGFGEVAYISPAYEKIWEKPTNRLYESPRSFLDAIHPADLDDYLATLDTYHRRGTSYSCEYRIIGKNGAIKWIHERGYPAPGLSDGKNLMTGVCADITASKKVESSLSEKERILRLMTDSAYDLISKHSEVGDYLYVSPSCRKLLGYRPEEMIGRSAYDFFHPEDLSAIRRSHRTVIEETGGYIVSYRIRRRDGTYLWVETNSGIIKGSEVGSGNEIIAITRDISARKKAEDEKQQFQSELQLRNQIATILLTSHGEQMYADVLALILGELDSQYGYFGYINRDGDLLCPSMTVDVWEKCAVAGKSIVFPKKNWGGLWGRSLHERRLMVANAGLKVPKGHIDFHRAMVAPVIHGGCLIGQIAVGGKPSDYTEADQSRLTSITEYIAPFLNQYLVKQHEEESRLQAEEALRASEAQLHDLSKKLINAQEQERQRIAVELHDELGQAMMVLKLQLRTILKSLDTERRDLQEGLESSVDYIDETVDRIRRLARELSPPTLRDLGLSAALTRLAQDMTQNTSIKVKMEVEDMKGLLSLETETTIYRVFQEALTNVVKHSRAGHVTLALGRSPEAVVCQLQDNGQGFDVAAMTQIDAAGDGMGLATMAERLRIINGDFECKSRPGKGTRITFSVPIENRGQ